MSPQQILTSIIGSIVVIFGAFFVTYLVARGSQKVYRGRVIQVLDRFSFTKDKSLMLIAVYDKIYLVAFAAGNVTLLDNIDPETAAAFAADTLNLEDKPRPPETLAALIFSRLRRQKPKNCGTTSGPPYPYEAYLHMEANDKKESASFFGMLQNSLEKEGRREEDNRP